MPPSPRLSARMMITTYLSVTMLISDQNTSDKRAEHVVVVDGDAVVSGKRFLEGVERTGADVSIHNPHGAEHEGGERLLGALLLVRLGEHASGRGFGGQSWVPRDVWRAG